jgi:monofunctional biosynthetic peptidoglycan transglycosylase
LSENNTKTSFKKITGVFIKVIGSFFFLAVVASIVMVLSLRWNNPNESRFIKLYEESAKRTITTEWIDFDDIAWHLPAAIIASEDQRFPNHTGFDWRQIYIAIEDKLAGKRLRGASTISQQTIKNMFLWPEKSFYRKAVEGWFTVWLEMLVPKKRILEIYMNIAQFGSSIFGVKAAAEYYFNVPASQLTAEQSRLLAICLPAPTRCLPKTPSEHSLKKSAWIADSINKLGGKRLIDRL